MEYLKRFAIWFITGFSATLGVLTAIFLGTLIKDYSYIFEPEVPLPIDKVVISGTELSTVTKQLTVSGAITNTSDQKLSEVVVKVELHRDNKLLHHCTDTLRKLPAPGKTSPFSADCYGVETRDIPQGASHKITVLSAHSRN